MKPFYKKKTALLQKENYGKMKDCFGQTCMFIQEVVTIGCPIPEEQNRHVHYDKICFIIQFNSFLLIHYVFFFSFWNNLFWGKSAFGSLTDVFVNIKKIGTPVSVGLHHSCSLFSPKVVLLKNFNICLKTETKSI